MNLELGWTYKFQFIKGFESLNSVYKLVKMYTYDELLEDGIDLSSSLYALVGKTEVEYEEDAPSYKTQKILKLKHPTSQSRIIYVPVGILAEIPNYNVKSYSKLALALELGIYPNTEDIAYVSNLLQEQLSTMLGFANAPNLIAISQVWLSDDEYQDITSSRENAKQVVNYFSENIKLREINMELTSRINALEQIIIEYQKSNSK